MGRPRRGRSRQSVQTFHEEVTGEEVTDCSGFTVLDDFTVDGRSIIFYDGDGNEIRRLVHLTFQDRFYNPNNGEEVTGTAHTNVELDPDFQENWGVGLQYHIKAPGGGLVFLSAGRVSYDDNDNLIFEAGLHPTFVDPSDLSERERRLLVDLCEELAELA
jgi:hypothetical protein